jgi:hypothetical protein
MSIRHMDSNRLKQMQTDKNPFESALIRLHQLVRG